MTLADVELGFGIVEVCPLTGRRLDWSMRLRPRLSGGIRDRFERDTVAHIRGPVFDCKGLKL